MKVSVAPSRAKGEVYAPPSKSIAHRLLIAAALANGTSTVKGISDCDDVRATADCLAALGAKIVRVGDDMNITGFDPRRATPRGLLDCRESGSTLRFMFPIALLCGKTATFCGARRLLERPLGVYEEICKDKGFLFERDGDTIKVCGGAVGTDISVRGDVSSQFITGLILAAPFSDSDVRIKITTKIESRSYIDLTLDAIGHFGVEALWESENTIYIKGGQSYCPATVSVEGDYSASAFTESFNLFGGEVTQLGLREDSLQGDRVYREHFRALASGYSEINLEDCPDLAPILFTVAAALHGAHFHGTARLKIKESDRAQVMAEELRKFGADITVCENDVTVKPVALHAPTDTLKSHGDHRVVMSLVTLMSIFGGEIEGVQAVNKSYPDYFKDISSLGIKIAYHEDQGNNKAN